MKPTIGYNVESILENGEWVPVNLERSSLYVKAITQCGGIAKALNFDGNLEEELKNLDGYLFTGGRDIPSFLYNEAPHEKLGCHVHSEKRFNFERSIFEALRGKIPILGICLGCQFINVVSGGSLVQHIEKSEMHSNGSKHVIKTRPDSLARKICGDQLMCSCYHHQTVKVLGRSISVSGYDEEEIPHIIESTNNEWIMGVQFHPERFMEDEGSVKIFKAFISACSVKS